MLAPHTRKHLLAALPAADDEPYRPKLEAQVCEPYAMVKRKSDRLLSGKTSFVDRLQ